MPPTTLNSEEPPNREDPQPLLPVAVPIFDY